MLLPLHNRRILITRPRAQASALAILLEEQGATTIQIPTIELAPPTSWSALDDAIHHAHNYDWLLFTSANAVESYTSRARDLGLTLRPNRIAAIGPATAKAVQGTGLAAKVDLIPPAYVAESFAQALTPYAPGSKLLLVRAAAARDTLPEALTTAGAHVTIAEAYQTVIPPDSIATLRKLFTTEARLDAITFTSASTAQNLAALLSTADLKIPPQTTLASIGPITSEAMRTLNLIPTIEARESTIPALVEALLKHFQS
jgi:uroporphyrinogen-III synthase